MKNYSNRNGDVVGDLSRKLSAHYAPIIARLHYNGVSDRSIVEGTGWDLRYHVSLDIVEKAVERARHTKRFMGYLLAEKMNDKRRTNSKNGGSKGSRKNS
ncbi:MAG: hypothetical protein AABX96_02070 [Nanoarchaeota archaeon]